jgi:hypothetical protein
LPAVGKRPDDDPHCLAADSRLAVRTDPRALRRALSVLAMLAGALVGALLMLRTDPVWALGSAAALMLVVASTAVALSRGTTGVDWNAPAGRVQQRLAWRPARRR